jgi:hypothetical protein
VFAPNKVDICQHPEKSLSFAQLMEVKLRKRVREIRNQENENALQPEIAELLDGLASQLPEDIDFNDASIPVRSMRFNRFVTNLTVSFVPQLFKEIDFGE